MFQHRDEGRDTPGPKGWKRPAVVKREVLFFQLLRPMEPHPFLLKEQRFITQDRMKASGQRLYHAFAKPVYQSPLLLCLSFGR